MDLRIKSLTFVDKKRSQLKIKLKGVTMNTITYFKCASHVISTGGQSRRLPSDSEIRVNESTESAEGCADG